MTDIDLKKELLALQYDVLGHYLVGGFTEIRIFSPGKPVRSHFVSTKEEFITEASKYLDSDGYVSVNPRRTASGTASDVSHVCSLVIDIDPVRERGVASTPEQHAASLEAGRRIIGDFPGSVQVSSGSGTHIYFPVKPIEIVSLENLTRSLKNWEQAIRGKYETKLLKVDHIFDVSRVIRLWGSFNTKSQRQCGPIGSVNPTARFSYEFSQAEEAPSPRIEVLDDLDERFNRLCKHNAFISGIMGGNDQSPDRSARDFGFVSALARAHFSPEEIVRLLRTIPDSRAEDGKDLAGDVRRILNKLSDNPEAGEPVHSLRGVGATKKYLQGLKERKMGLSTGFPLVDETISGLKSKKLIILAARPTEGKTSLITQMLTSIAEQGKAFLFFPTEVGSEPIYDKIVSAKTKINLKKFQNGDFTDAESKKIAEIMPSIEKLPLMVVEDFAITPDKIEAYVKKYAPQGVAIDYFQALKWKNPDSLGEKEEAVYRFKKLAVDYDIPVILACQLRRFEGKRHMGLLKDCGKLEEFADIIMFIEQMDKMNYPVSTDLDIMKSKYSDTRCVKMNFYKSHCYLEEKTQQ